MICTCFTDISTCTYKNLSNKKACHSWVEVQPDFWVNSQGGQQVREEIEKVGIIKVCLKILWCFFYCFVWCMHVTFTALVLLTIISFYCHYMVPLYKLPSSAHVIWTSILIYTHKNILSCDSWIIIQKATIWWVFFKGHGDWRSGSCKWVLLQNKDLPQQAAWGSLTLEGGGPVHLLVCTIEVRGPGCSYWCHQRYQSQFQWAWEICAHRGSWSLSAPQCPKIGCCVHPCPKFHRVCYSTLGHHFIGGCCHCFESVEHEWGDQEAIESSRLENPVLRRTVSWHAALAKSLINCILLSAGSKSVILLLFDGFMVWLGRGHCEESMDTTCVWRRGGLIFQMQMRGAG